MRKAMKLENKKVVVTVTETILPHADVFDVDDCDDVDDVNYDSE